MRETAPAGATNQTAVWELAGWLARTRSTRTPIETITKAQGADRAEAAGLAR
jgi:hypothetical protein